MRNSDTFSEFRITIKTTMVPVPNVMCHINLDRLLTRALLRLLTLPVPISDEEKKLT